MIMISTNAIEEDLNEKTDYVECGDVGWLF